MIRISRAWMNSMKRLKLVPSVEDASEIPHKLNVPSCLTGHEDLYDSFDVTDEINCFVLKIIFEDHLYFTRLSLNVQRNDRTQWIFSVPLLSHNSCFLPFHLLNSLSLDFFFWEITLSFVIWFVRPKWSQRIMTWLKYFLDCLMELWPNGCHSPLRLLCRILGGIFFFFRS